MAYTQLTAANFVDPEVHADNLTEMDTLLSSLQRRSKQLLGTLYTDVPDGFDFDIDFPTDQVVSTIYNSSFLFNELDQIAPVGDLVVESHIFYSAEPHAISGTFSLWTNSSPSGGFVYPCAGSSSLLADGSFDSAVYAAINPADPSVDSVPELDIALIPTDGTWLEVIYKTRINDWGGAAGASGLSAGAAFYHWARFSSANVGNLMVHVSPHSFWTLNQLV
jgi:hypothetical protein